MIYPSTKALTVAQSPTKLYSVHMCNNLEYLILDKQPENLGIGFLYQVHFIITIQIFW